jgi:hypothetical protein
MTLAGVWENEYGSRMRLATRGDRIAGTYASTTGSTGSYRVVGRARPGAATPARGRPVALAIAWRSIAHGPADESWHWASGLAGQLCIADGAPALILSHALVASTDFPGLAAAGTYLDKLVYRRIGDAADAALDPPDPGPPAADPLAGAWRSDDGAMRLAIAVHRRPGDPSGQVRGDLRAHGGACAIDGVADGEAAPARRSAALVALPGDADGPAIVLAGCLDRRTDVLTLLDLSSRSTPADAAYLQTMVTQRTFRRLGAA